MAEITSLFKYSHYGEPNVLEWTQEALNPPEENEIQIAHTAIGVNYLDIIQRSGAQQAAQLPQRIGVEGVGVIESIGSGVEEFSKGDRVAYAGGPPGSYAVKRNLPASRAIKIPDEISDKTCAALFFKGLTAEYLIHRCYPVKTGDSVLFHAAAGGVGLIATQWLKAIGAVTIGSVGSVEKVKKVKHYGCDHVINYSEEDIKSAVMNRTAGAGVDVVYDSVGKDTYIASLDSLKPRGTMVSFGAASGLPPEISVSDLVQRGSLFLTRPSIAHYIADRTEYLDAANNLFAAIKSKTVQIEIITRYQLTAAVQAHDDLESRKTSGSIVLIP